MGNFKGTIIEESLSDTAVLKKFKILSTQVEPVTDKHKTPWVTQWTLHSIELPFSEAREVAEAMSKALDPNHVWYADFKNELHHYIIFKGKVFFVNRGSKEQYDEVVKYGISLGIPEYQLDFDPEISEWKK